MGLEGKTIIDWLIEKCPCGKTVLPEQRTVYINGRCPRGVEPVPQNFHSNRVVSSKYTAWNFLFKNIFEQFHRIANIYFLIMAIVSALIDSPVNPWTSAFPLILVILVTMIKQGYEDVLRHRADKEVNNRPAHVVRNGELIEVKAHEIKVGDIVRVAINGGIPCDMLLLSSEDHDGKCYITTANLDGETNLKTYRCVPETKSCRTEMQLQELCGVIKSEQPNTELYKYAGRLLLYTDDNPLEQKSLGADNILLRGSRLKNTAYVYGCAVFTGQDTKISMNSKITMLKFSRIERRMNWFLVIFLIFLLTYSVIWTGLKYWYYSLDKNSADLVWYKEGEPGATAAKVFEDFLIFMVLCNYVIPISLYVTIEMQKIIGSKFFEWDMDMYDVLTNEPAKANTSDLNEELGQVEYLFTDKTGTMTENRMEFRQCYTNGNHYVEIGGLLAQHRDLSGIPEPVHELTPDIEDMFRILLLCNTVRVDRKEDLAVADFAHSGVEYIYEASSPDEKALVEAGRRHGIVFHGSKDDKLFLTFRGRLQQFTLHHTLDFDATRKRMSVIVEDEGRRTYLMTKGADTAIFAITSKGDIPSAEKKLEEFAVLGLRTLCVAQKELTPEEFMTFDHLMKDALLAFDDREEKLQLAYEAIERNVTLVGVTAVEDKLQDGVPETFVALREAGIKVWVVTGDKEETAVNISYSAGHFDPGMTEIRLTRHENGFTCGQKLAELWKLLEDYRSLGDKRYCLIIDGPSLRFAIQEHKDLLRKICMNVVTVLACRTTPLQKAEVVALIKYSKENPCTAAIGDGANDVSMILEAHVGLGIMGKEGRQAVRSSDYAFGRFRFLQKALLVHGHYYYVRLAVLVQYFFYKNVAMILAQLYFTFLSAYSAQSVYDGLFLTFYNITMTALPILLYGLFEQHCRPDILLRNPRLYRTIHNNKRLSYPEFVKWNLIGVWHSLIFFWGVYFAMSPGNAPADDGQHYGVYEFGAIVFTACVFTANIKLALESYHFNGVIWFGYALTLVGYYALIFLISEIWWPFLFENTFYKSYAKILSAPFTWLLLAVLVVAALLVDICIRTITDTFSTIYKMYPRRTMMRNPWSMSANGKSRTSSYGDVKVNQVDDVKVNHVYEQEIDFDEDPQPSLSSPERHSSPISLDNVSTRVQTPKNITPVDVTENDNEYIVHL